MARRGDIVECWRCGAVLRLDNDRVPWHKRAGTHVNCSQSGAAAESWDAVYAIMVAGAPVVLQCPACRERGRIQNAGGTELACGGCGVVAGVAEFARAGIRKRIELQDKAKKEAAEPRRHRYGG